MDSKIIFLDMDGVLNSTNYAIKNNIMYFYRRAEFLDLANVEQLKRIITVTDAKIVISSAWRRYMSLDEFIVLFARVKVYNIIGMTNPDRMLSRAIQINQYVIKHNIKCFVVLDDGLLIRKESDVVPKRIKRRFVRTSQLYGLQKEDADKAIKILNGS